MDSVIQEMQAEIQRLKFEVSSTPASSPIPAMKDVTLVAGIKDQTGDIKGRTVHEFFAQIDTYAKVVLSYTLHMEVPICVATFSRNVQDFANKED